MNSRQTVATILAIIFPLAVFVSCEEKGEAMQSPPIAPTESPASARDGITFVSGFYAEETSPMHTLRWVHQEAALRAQAPTEGKYKLILKPFTVFSPAETVVEITVNGQLSGSVSTKTFDLDNIPATSLTVTLHAGGNDIALKSNRSEVSLGEKDSRTVSFGLILPVKVERLP
jgi:hypothetical protein